MVGVLVGIKGEKLFRVVLRLGLLYLLVIVWKRVFLREIGKSGFVVNIFVFCFLDN